MSNKQKKNKGISVQDLIGIRCFSDYGLKTNFGELLFYIVTPTNISVLSHTSIDEKIRELMLVLSAVPSYGKRRKPKNKRDVKARHPLSRPNTA